MSETTSLSPAEALRLIAPVFSESRVEKVEPLRGGLRNAHFLIHVEGRDEPLVLRSYGKDPSVCRKEIRLLELVRETVPVPSVLHAEPDGVGDAPPYVLLTHVKGVSLRELKRLGDTDALRALALSVGAALAEIGRYEFPEAGRLGDELEAKGPFVKGPDTVPKFLDACLDSPHFRRRVGAELASRIHEMGWSWRERLATLESERRLVHGDFNAPNLLAREIGGEWQLVAVLDWEFGFSGSPLFDVGNFLRYEREDRPVLEPAFSRSFVDHGGELADDWKRLVRVVDSTALCEMLAREELLDGVAGEVLGLLKATLDVAGRP